MEEMDVAYLARLLEQMQSDIAKFSTIEEGSHDRFKLKEKLRVQARAAITLIDGPKQSVKNIAREYVVPVAFKICMDLDLARMIEGGDLTTHSSRLSSMTGADPAVLNAILDLLSTQGIFRKKSNAQWQHSDLSETLLDASFADLINSTLDESLRTCCALPSFLLRTKYQLPSPHECAFNSEFETKLSFYEYCSMQDAKRSSRFARAMNEVAQKHLDFFLAAYPISRLPKESMIVDVAGGLGHTAIFLAQRFADRSFAVQDLEPIVQQGKDECPPELSHRIQFQRQDMFQSSPTDSDNGEQPVFLLKTILHDYSDTECVRILTNLVPQLGSSGRILIIDTVKPEMEVSVSTAMSDLMTMSLFGGRHRTLREFRDLIQRTDERLVVTPWYGNGGEHDDMLTLEVQLAAPSTTV